MSTKSGKIALVTGANRGIGYEIARLLASKGMTVVMGARDEAQGAEACERLSVQGYRVERVLLDVRDETAIAAGVGKITDRYGRLDVLVNNAGIMIDGQTGILELSPALFLNTLQTNAMGPLLLCQACIPWMKKNGYGRIVNISSTMGSLNDIANPDSTSAGVKAPSYRLSKTLLNGITVLVALEVRAANILVNSVCPGWARTRMGGELAPLPPAEAADTAVWLATLPDDGPTGGFFRERRPIPW